MAWQCTKCSRFWGRCRRTCPLCLAISERQLCLLKLATSARLPNEVRIMIGESLGVFRPLLPLPKLSLCRYGSPLNCRCADCRHVAPYIFTRYSTKYRRGRAVAARWVHMLALVVGAARSGSWNVLTGLFLPGGHSLATLNAPREEDEFFEGMEVRQWRRMMAPSRT